MSRHSWISVLSLVVSLFVGVNNTAAQGPPVQGVAIKDNYPEGTKPETRINAWVSSIDNTAVGTWMLPARGGDAAGPVPVSCTVVKWVPSKSGFDVSDDVRDYDGNWKPKGKDFNDPRATGCIKTVEGRFGTGNRGDAMVEACYKQVVADCVKQQPAQLVTAEDFKALRSALLGSVEKAIDDHRLSNDLVQDAVRRVQSDLLDSVKAALVAEVRKAIPQEALREIEALKARLKVLEDQAKTPPK